MKYYEIKNTKNGHCFQTYANTTKEACTQYGYKANHCKVIYCCEVDQQ